MDLAAKNPVVESKELMEVLTAAGDDVSGRGRCGDVPEDVKEVDPETAPGDIMGLDLKDQMVRVEIPDLDIVGEGRALANTTPDLEMEKDQEIKEREEAEIGHVAELVDEWADTIEEEDVIFRFEASDDDSLLSSQDTRLAVPMRVHVGVESKVDGVKSGVAGVEDEQVGADLADDSVVAEDEDEIWKPNGNNDVKVSVRGTSDYLSYTSVDLFLEKTTLFGHVRRRSWRKRGGRRKNGISDGRRMRMKSRAKIK